MERIHFCVATVDEAETVVGDLRGLGISDEHIHVIASDTNLANEPVPEAGVAQTSNVGNAARKGAVAGGTMGLAGGLALLTFPPAGVAVGAAAVLGTTALGTALGTWMSTMIGVSVPNEDLEALQSRIDAGEVLVLADVEADSADAVLAAVKRRNADIVLHHGDQQQAEQ